MPIDWSGIQTAYLDLQRRRLGLPSREELAMKRAAEARAQSASESALESAALGREKTRAEIAAMPGEREQRSRLVEAQIANYNEPNRAPASTGTWSVTPDGKHRINNMTGEVVAVDVPGGVGKAPGEGRQPGRPYPAMIGGKLVYVDPDTRQPIEGMTPPPTAEMRNTDYQSQALTPAFESMKQSLAVLKGFSGGMTGLASAAVPGTDAYWAKSAFVDKTKALAGAITARMAGEGSRLSDEDRVAYSRASAIVDNMILLPGGVEEAERRLTEVQQLLEEIQARRNRAAGGFDTARGTDAGGGAVTTVRTAAEYAALPSGTVFIDPNGKRRKKP